jgi:hypothetical protein
MITDGHMILLFLGFLGLLQGACLIMLWIGMGKITNLCGRMDDIQKQVGGKASIDDHKKVQVTLGEYGDRILTLELAVKVIEKVKV